LKKAGLEAPESDCVEGNWSCSSGEAAFEQLLRSCPEMDAVFVANDQMALSVLQLANCRGIKVPGELAVIGFDNMAESAYFWPALTTIHHNQHELGGRAVQEVVGQIEAGQRDEAIQQNTILLTPELIARASTVRSG
jgi:LacI family transcriptional regulator